MKTALKIIGGLLGVLALAAAVFYFGWLSPPSPESVCENVMKVTKAEVEKAGGSISDDDFKGAEQACMKRASKAPEFGRGPWVKRLKCMRDAPDGAALEKCDKIRSM